MSLNACYHIDGDDKVSVTGLAAGMAAVQIGDSSDYLTIFTDAASAAELAVVFEKAIAASPYGKRGGEA